MKKIIFSLVFAMISCGVATAQVFDHYVGQREGFNIYLNQQQPGVPVGLWEVKKNNISVVVYSLNFQNPWYWSPIDTSEVERMNYFEITILDTLTLLPIYTYLNDSVYVHDEGFFCAGSGEWTSTATYGVTREIFVGDSTSADIIMRSVRTTRDTSEISIVPFIEIGQDQFGDYKSRLYIYQTDSSAGGMITPFYVGQLQDTLETCKIINPDKTKVYHTKWKYFQQCPGDEDNGVFKTFTAIGRDTSRGMTVDIGGVRKQMNFVRKTQPILYPTLSCYFLPDSIAGPDPLFRVEWAVPGVIWGHIELTTIIIIDANNDTVFYNQAYNIHSNMWNIQNLNENSYYKVIFIQGREFSCTSIYLECEHLATVNIESSEIKAFNLFPNPATDVVIINVETIERYEILSINGQVLKSGELLPGENQIEIRSLPEGTYLFRVGHKVARFSKQ